MGITFGVTGPSGLDLNSMVDSLVSIEQNKVTKVQNEKDSYQVKVDAYNKVRSLLFDLKSKSDAISQNTSFDIFKAATSNSAQVEISGTSGSADGSYSVNVFQTATNEKMISADGRITSLSATLASQGVTVGDISIGGMKITINASDTLNDLRAKINSAVDSKGNRLGAAASVVKISDTDFRLIVSANTSGSAGLEYKDLTGSTLQDLGFITNADGDKGTTSQVLKSTDDIMSAWGALAVGESISYAGTDHDGAIVSNTFLKTAGSTLNDFFAQVKSSFHNAAEVTTDADGILTITDSIGGASKMIMNKLSFGGNDHTVKLSEAGTAGKGVLATGKDAYFSVEGMLMKTTTNVVSDVIAGTTFTLHDTTAGVPVTVGLSRDLDSVTANFKALIDSYNNLASYADNAEKVGDPTNSNSKSGELAGDLTLVSLVDKVRSSFRNQYSFNGGDLKNLTSIGVNSDPQTGAISLDEKKFKKALQTDLDGVKRLFTTTSSSDNTAISLGRNTDKTQAGKYVLEEIDPDHVRIRKANSTQWYTSAARIGDVITFNSGPATDLSIACPQGSISGSSTFTFSKGFAATLSETLTQMVDSQNGVVALRQTALQGSMKRADDRIASLSARVASYRDRLIKQFSSMETALSGLQQQSSSITRAFGTNSSS